MTEFGCCIDQENAAYGPDFEGCPDEDGSGAGFVDCSTSVSLFCRIMRHVHTLKIIILLVCHLNMFFLYRNMAVVQMD